jgi:hypothetical protein
MASLGVSDVKKLKFIRHEPLNSGRIRHALKKLYNTPPLLSLAELVKKAVFS